MAPSTRSKLRIARHRWPLVAAMTAATLLAAACGSAAGSGKSGGSGTAGGTSVTAWIVTTGPSPVNTKINQAVSDFEAHHHGDHITVDYIENQSYKQKIQLAMGAGNHPTIFWTWVAARSSSTSARATCNPWASPATHRASCRPRWGR